MNKESKGRGVTLVEPAVWLYSNTGTSCFLPCLLCFTNSCWMLNGQKRTSFLRCILSNHQGWKHQMFAFWFLFNWEVSGDIVYLKVPFFLKAPLKKNPLHLWSCEVIRFWLWARSRLLTYPTGGFNVVALMLYRLPTKSINKWFLQNGGSLSDTATF